jgi:hypothetical protein
MTQSTYVLRQCARAATRVRARHRARMQIDKMRPRVILDAPQGMVERVSFRLLTRVCLTECETVHIHQPGLRLQQSSHAKLASRDKAHLRDLLIVSSSDA